MYLGQAGWLIKQNVTTWCNIYVEKQRTKKWPLEHTRGLAIYNCFSWNLLAIIWSTKCRSWYPHSLKAATGHCTDRSNKITRTKHTILYRSIKDPSYFPQGGVCGLICLVMISIWLNSIHQVWFPILCRTSETISLTRNINLFWNLFVFLTFKPHSFIFN